MFDYIVHSNLSLFFIRPMCAALLHLTIRKRNSILLYNNIKKPISITGWNVKGHPNHCRRYGIPIGML